MGGCWRAVRAMDGYWCGCSSKAARSASGSPPRTSGASARTPPCRASGSAAAARPWLSARNSASARAGRRTKNSAASSRAALGRTSTENCSCCARASTVRRPGRLRTHLTSPLPLTLRGASSRFGRSRVARHILRQGTRQSSRPCSWRYLWAPWRCGGSWPRASRTGCSGRVSGSSCGCTCRPSARWSHASTSPSGRRCTTSEGCSRCAS
mmetsp:Transcript_150056/g.482300  ORF Transcript_150056/g.482300 Transcript_150056/m.482300 type:complete len:210 (-) Transcript_150056:530-1159(-)